jgi:hypothetical protein
MNFCSYKRAAVAASAFPQSQRSIKMMRLRNTVAQGLNIIKPLLLIDDCGFHAKEYLDIFLQSSWKNPLFLVRPDD